MTAYPDSAYTPVMDFYNGLPAELKPGAQKVLKDFERYKQGEAPPDEMLQRLKALTKTNAGGLEAKMHDAHAEMPASKATSQIGNYVIAGLGALATGLAMATNPLLGALTLATAALTFYSTNRVEYAPSKNKH